MYLQNQIIDSCSEENGLVFMLGIFSGKLQPVHFPLMNLPEADHPKYLMHKLEHLYQKDLINSYMEVYVHSTDFSWVMWM